MRSRLPWRMTEARLATLTILASVRGPMFRSDALRGGRNNLPTLIRFGWVRPARISGDDGRDIGVPGYRITDEGLAALARARAWLNMGNAK